MRRQLLPLLLLSILLLHDLQAQTFSRITSDPTVLGSNDGWGASWGDYDNDGDPDLFVSFADQANALFANNGDGTFARVTNTPISIGNVVTTNGMWMDYDADGDLDLYVSNYGTQGEGVFTVPVGQRRPNQLYRNDDGAFTVITDSPLVTERNASWGSSWADYDNDGDLDVFVAGDSGHENHLFQNDGTGAYTLVTDTPIVTAGSPTRTATWIDYDDDGDLDLFLLHFMTGGTRMNLYRNTLTETGTAAFEELGNTPMETDGFASGTWSGTWADYDNDGRQDLYIATYFSGSANLLYRNTGGDFQAVTQHNLARESESSTGVCWADYDNDGDLDVFIGVSSTRIRASHYYENEGGGVFRQVTMDAFENARTFVTGCASADYDNDGDLDLYVLTGSGFFLVNPAPNMLFRNDDGNQNNWINLTLRGSGLNPYAIGARVDITATLNGQSRTQSRWLSGNPAGDRTQSDMRIHVGLADATTIDQITVHWPSGITETFDAVAANQFLLVAEGESLAPVANEAEGALPHTAHLAQNYPNPFNTHTTLTYSLDEPTHVRLTIHDLLGRTIDVLTEGFYTAGTHHLSFDASGLASGLYTYRLANNGVVQTKQMVVMR